MVDERRPRNPNDDLPDPIRQLAYYGNYFGVAVDKKPILPAAWKKHEEKLMTYNDAVGKRDALKANGHKALLYYVTAKTPVRPLDFDADKATGELRPQQVKALDYYRDEVKAPIAISSSGVGRHVYLIDEDKQLPVIGNNEVEAGKIPFEIKHGIIFITDEWEQRCPIPKVDSYTIKIANEVKSPTPPTPPTPPVSPAPTTQQPIDDLPAPRILMDDNRKARSIIAWFKKNKIALCPDNDSFLRIGFNLKACIYTNDEVHEIMRNEQGYTDDAYKRICSFKPKTRQIGSLIDYAKSHGYQPGNEEPDDKIELDTMERTEADQPREQITPRLTARGDSIAVSGRPGGGKTEHVMSWMRDCNDLGLHNIIVNMDMPTWQSKDRLWRAKLDPEKTTIVQLRGKVKIRLDKLIETLKKEIGDKKIGCFVIDNAAVFFRLVWESVSNKPFNPNDDACAIEIHNKIITPLAEAFDCCVVFIGHAAKNSASKDKFPGSEQLTALAGLAYRIYRLNFTNIDETPKSILKLFNKLDKPADYSLASLIKPRYPKAKSYFMRLTKEGTETEDVEDDPDLAVTDKHAVIPDHKEYVERMNKLLRDNKGKSYGSVAMNKALGYSGVNYHWWVGVITTSTEWWVGISPVDGMIYHRFYNGKPVAFCHRKEDRE